VTARHAPHSCPQLTYKPLSSGKAIAALSPADQAAWTKYYLGEEVPGEAGKKALAAAVGITKK